MRHWLRTSSIAFALTILAAAALAQDADEAPPPPPWSSSVGAGLALTSGNSDTQNINLSLATLFDPKTGRTFKADVLYLSGESDGETQVDKTTAAARYARDLDRSFWFGELSYLRDPLKGIDYLISPIVGLGYDIIRSELRTFSVDAGVGGAFERSHGLGSDASAAIKLGESFEWAISPTSRLTQRVSGLWKADDTDDAHYHFDAGISTTIVARAELKLSYVYDYKNQPPTEFEKGDSALFAALVYKF